jgi:hypothetical protein
MKVLIGCEFSGRVREAFASLGHHAYSCDLLPTEIPSRNHIQGDIFDLLKQDPYWDLAIFFYPCTNMALSGARWFKNKKMEQAKDIEDFIKLFTFPTIPKIASENPIGILSTKFREPDQIIQPYEYGHPETKPTCLWLKGLKELTPTKFIPEIKEYSVVDGKNVIKVRNRSRRVTAYRPDKDRWMKRSRTYPGIAKAMAEQWG